MKKRMRLVAILLVALLIIPGNLVFANQFGETTNVESNSQEEIDVDEVLPSPLPESLPVPNPDNETITINFDTRGGNSIEPLIVDKGSSLVDLPRPLRGDERFLGWATESGEPVNVPLEVAENTTLYAVWRMG